MVCHGVPKLTTISIPTKPMTIPIHATHKALIPAWVWERRLGNAGCDLGVLAPSLPHPHHITWYVFLPLALSLPCLMLSGFPVCTFILLPGYIPLSQFLFYFWIAKYRNTWRIIYIRKQTVTKSLSAPDFVVHKCKVVTKWMQQEKRVMFVLICFWHTCLILHNYRVGGTLLKQGDKWYLTSQLG